MQLIIDYMQRKKTEPMLLLVHPLDEAVSTLERKLRNMLCKMSENFWNGPLIMEASVTLPWLHHRLL